MDLNEMKFTFRILKKHYELGMSQEEIALEENVSKSKVNRIIKKAISEGYIKITVNYPIQSVQDLEEEFKKTFSLKRAFFAPVIVDNDELIKVDVCKAVGQDLARLIRNDDIVGISWGRTMECVAENLPKMNLTGVKVVQINGGVSMNIKPTRASEITEQFTEAVNGVGYILPMPAIVDNNIIADVIKKDSQIRNALSLIDRSRIVVFSLGRVSFDSVLYRAGYFSEEEYLQLQKKGAVGDICSRYYDAGGNVVDRELDGRAIGASLDVLKSKEFSIGVAVGKEKANAALGALNGGYINSFYSDENTAREILELNRQIQKFE